MQNYEIEQDRYYVETVDHKDETVFVCCVTRSDCLISVENKSGTRYLTLRERITREATMNEIREFNA